MSLLIQPGQRIVFFGDSITCARRKADTPDLGNGYVAMIDTSIRDHFPTHKLQLINAGIDGSTAVSLSARLEDDVLRHDPEWVSILVGINDLTRWIRDPASEPGGVDAFKGMLDALVSDILRLADARVVLLDPFYISNDREPSPSHARVLRLLQPYIAAVAEIAAKYGTIHVETHAAFAQELLSRPAAELCPEPIHPNAAGHAVIAQAWLAAMGA